MRTNRLKPRGLAAFAAVLALPLAGGVFAQENKEKTRGAPDAAKPEKPEARKKAPAPAPARKAKPKEHAKKTAEPKIELRILGADGKEMKNPEIIKKGSVHVLRSPHSGDQELKPRPWLGIAMRTIPDSLREYLDLNEGFGVQVEHVVGKSPADEAGLKVHDILTKLDDQQVISPEHVALLVRSKKKGARVEVTFIRKGKEQTADVTLGERDLPPFSDSPARVPNAIDPYHRGHGHDLDRDGDPDRGFGFYFGEPGKEGHFEFRLPGDGKENKELQRYLEGYGEMLKQWFEKNPDLMPNRWQFGQPREQARPPKPIQPGNAPDSGKPNNPARPKPIPPLPDQNSGKPPAISVRPGLPLEVFGGAGIVKIDNPKGAVTITAKDGEHKITIKNPDGETVYEGPYNAAEGSKGLPKEAQEQLKAMKLDDLKLMLPAPRPPKSKPKPKPETGGGSANPNNKGKGELL